MKLLAVVADIDADNLGGAEWHFVEVLKRIAKHYTQITLIVGPSTNIERLLSGLPQVEIIPINYPHVTNLFSLFFIIFATPVVLKLQLREKYDLVWAKQEFPQGVVAGLVKLIFKTPLYLTTQSARLHKDEMVIKGVFPNWLKSLLQDLAVPFIRFSFRQADLVGAVSKFSAQQAQLSGAKNVFIAPNGVDTNSFTSSKKAGTPTRIVTTSSLIFRNAVDILIRACHLLPKDLTWSLKIAGSGPLLSDLKKLRDTLGLSQKISFLGRVANRDIPDLLAKSDIFVRVSRAEGFGTSFLEAMAAGLPVIATKQGGIVDFIKHNQTGLLVPVDSPSALRDGIMQLFSNKTLYKKLQKNALALVKRQYNWDLIAERIWQEISSLPKP